MTTVWIVGLEPIEQRYTAEWSVHLPLQVRKAISDHNIDAAIRVIRGPSVGGQTTRGAFLDFAATNIFKAAQVTEIARAFQSGEVQAGDRFLFTDAWHFGVTAVRYMSDLLKVPVKLVGLFHAGSYDPQDFLGRIPDTRWAKDFERSLYRALDMSCFATDFHVDMFVEALEIDDPGRVIRCGWPMEYLPNMLAASKPSSTRRLVLFPHRLAPEKQVEIFRDLAASFPDYEFRVCQDQVLSKSEYHALLGKAALIFSASLQETLGIGLYEGLLCGARPFAPARLSYAEMYPGEYLYPPEWTADWQGYIRYKYQLVDQLKIALDLAKKAEGAEELQKLAIDVGKKFFDGGGLYEALFQ